MAWIELHQSLWTHRKTLILAALLGIEDTYAAAHMARFWCWALDNAPRGDLTNLPPKVIAYGAGWRGDADAFVEAAITAGFLDRQNGRLQIHDWDDYAGRLIERREAERERSRQRRQAQRPTVDQQTTNGRPPVDRATTAGTVPNSTVPNQVLSIDSTSHDGLKEKESANADSLPPSAAPPSESVQAVQPYPKSTTAKAHKPAGEQQGKKNGRRLLPEAWELAAEIVDDMRRNDGTPPRDKEKIKFASAIDKLMRARDSPADAEEIRAMWEWAKTDKEATKIRTWPGRLADVLAAYRAAKRHEELEYEARKWRL